MAMRLNSTTQLKTQYYPLFVGLFCLYIIIMLTETRIFYITMCIVRGSMNTRRSIRIQTQLVYFYKTLLVIKISGDVICSIILSVWSLRGLKGLIVYYV